MRASLLVLVLPLVGLGSCSDEAGAPASRAGSGNAGQAGAGAGRGGANSGAAGGGQAGGAASGGMQAGAGGEAGGGEAGSGGAEAAGRGGNGAGNEAGNEHGGAGASGSEGTTAGASGDGGAGGEGGTASEPCVAFELPDDCAPQAGSPLPAELRCTGLYGDFERRSLSCGVREFRPAYELWSDGAAKRRFVSLPEGAAVDASDPDNWSFPVGTQFWKEFRVGDGRRLGETRLLRKTSGGWVYTTYVWSEDGRSAEQVNGGVADLFGTGHSVPTRDQCRDCHSGRPDFVLGWDLVQLGAGASGLTVEDLRAEGRLAGAPAQPAVPGDEVERAALGYLHANCGVSCHNITEEAMGRSSGLFLRLDVSTLGSVHTTDAVTTGVNRIPDANVALPPGGPYYDLRPLDVERSLLVERMSRRDEFAMPRIGTNAPDAAGIAAISAWIESMTAERGYPAAAP